MLVFSELADIVEVFLMLRWMLTVLQESQYKDSKHKGTTMRLNDGQYPCRAITSRVLSYFHF